MSALLAEALAKKKASLQQTQTKDSSGLIVDKWTGEALTKYQNDVLDINLESWYDLIAEHTFYTVFVPLTLEDARLFISYYAFSHPTEDQAGVIPDLNYAEAFANMEGRIAAVLDDVRGTASGIFIKTSSRSPKDSARLQGGFDERYKAHLAAFGDTSVNSKLISLLAAGQECMQITTATAAVLLLKESERIFQDMNMAIKYPDRWNTNFVLRRWVDLSPGMEFRGFCFKGRLTAIGQYNALCFFEGLAANRDHLMSLIQPVFDDCAVRLAPKFESYIIDFGVDAEGKVWVIELNPFLETTDAGLFHWTNDVDVIEGRAPFEFRVNNSPPAGVIANLNAEWRAMLA